MSRRFPIMQWGSIPWDVIAPHEGQAMRNHGWLTLENLASRGGLDVIEAVAVLEGHGYPRTTGSLEFRGEFNRCIQILIQQYEGGRGQL